MHLKINIHSTDAHVEVVYYAPYIYPAVDMAIVANVHTELSSENMI